MDEIEKLLDAIMDSCTMYGMYDDILFESIKADRNFLLELIKSKLKEGSNE